MGLPQKDPKISYNKFINFLKKNNLYYKKNYKYFSDKYVTGSLLLKV